MSERRPPDHKSLGLYWKAYDFMPDDMRSLSSDAVRLLVDGWCWSRRHGLDGHLPARDLQRMTYLDSPEAAATELCRAVIPNDGQTFWRATPSGWQIVYTAHGQATADGIADGRANARARQARRRAKLKNRSSSDDETA